MKRSPWRAVWGIGVVLLVSGFAGAVFGAQAQAGKDKDVDNALKNFSSVLGLIEENYVDKVDSDNAVYGAIAGMLRTLDPHSTFFDPKAFASTREDHHSPAGRGRADRDVGDSR